MATAGSRPDLHARFRAVVARGLSRAEREHAEHLARLRPLRRQAVAERRQAHGAVAFPRRIERPPSA